MHASPLWVVRASGGDLVDDFRSGGLVAIGWKEAGQFPADLPDDQMKERFSRTYPDERPATRAVWLGMVKRFLREIQVGDEVLTYDPNERIYFLGRVDSEAKWRDAPEPRFRSVTWTQKVPRDSLSLGTRNRLGSIATLFRVAEDAAREVRQRAVHIDSTTPAPTSDAAATTLDTTEDDASENLRDDVANKADEFIEDKLASLAWDDMQELVAGILRAMGYRTQVSLPGSDRGIDIFASPDGLGLQEPRIFVEVKHRRGSTMGAEEIRSFLGGRRPGDRCLYVSTGGFTKDARYEAERANVPLRLVNMSELRALLLQFYEKMDAQSQALIPLRRLYWPTD